MNLILLESTDYIAKDRVYLGAAAQRNPNTIKTSERRAQHIRDILGAKIGDRIKVGAVNGLLGSAEILRCDADGVEMRVVLTEAPPAKLPLTLILALPRPKVLRRIVRTVAELGVQRLILLNTYKVEKSYWQTPALAPEQMHDYLLEGLQQARDSVLPLLQHATRFKPFVEDQLPALAADTQGLVAHPGSDAKPCPLALNRACTLAIGPEGGFTPYEIEKLQRAGLQHIQLGARILRVENALTSLVARLFT